MSELRPQLSKCISTYFEPAIPGGTLREVFHIVADPSRYPIDIAGPVGRNQAIAHLVFRTDFLQTRLQDWMSESPEGGLNAQMLLERTFTLLGRQASRNLVACIQVQKILGILPRKKNDRFAVLPSDQIRFATGAEALCQESGFAFSDHAYIGGFHYDLLQACLQKQKGPRDAIAAFGTQYAESLKIARIAYELASQMGEFKLNPLVFSAALSLGIGKLLMQALHPKELLAKSYNSFLVEADKLKVGKWEHLEIRERMRFGIDHPELASHFVAWVGMIPETEAAIRYYQEPFYLKTAAPDACKLACLIHLASAIVLGRPFIESHAWATRNLDLKESHIARARKKAGK